MGLWSSSSELFGERDLCRFDLGDGVLSLEGPATHMRRWCEVSLVGDLLEDLVGCE